MKSEADQRYPATSYERAAEALADAAEDFMYTVDEKPGENLSVLQAAWQHFAKVAAPCFDRGDSDDLVEDE